MLAVRVRLHTVSIERQFTPLYKLEQPYLEGGRDRVSEGERQGGIARSHRLLGIFAV